MSDFKRFDALTLQLEIARDCSMCHILYRTETTIMLYSIHIYYVSVCLCNTQIVFFTPDTHTHTHASLCLCLSRSIIQIQNTIYTHTHIPHNTYTRMYAIYIYRSLLLSMLLFSARSLVLQFAMISLCFFFYLTFTHSLANQKPRTDWPTDQTNLTIEDRNVT